MKKLLKVMAVAGVGAALGAVVLLWAVLQDLPALDGMADYRPPVASKVYDRNGELIARFFQERRTVIQRAQMPDRLIKAFLAAEDADFYEHHGVDPMGVVAALVQEVVHKVFGGPRRGGSTITQQVAKTFLLSPQQTYTRKLREMVLAWRVEKAFTKDEILFLYLNQIYFGNGAYGVEEAAQTYFGKHAWELTLAECAVVASIPKNPTRINPMFNPNRTLQRRAYVLGQMKERGFATAEEVAEATAAPLFRERPPNEFLGRTPYYAEDIRRLLLERFGEDAVFREGLVAYAAVDARLDVVATRALRHALEAVDRRRGWRGPLVRLDPEVLRSLRVELQSHLEDRLPADAQTRAQMAWDLQHITARMAADPPAAAAEMQLRYRDVGAVLAGLVESVDADGAAARVDLGTVRGELPFSEMKWARPRKDGSLGPAPRTVRDVLAVGDIILVRVLKQDSKAGAGVPLLGLEQVPEVQGALVAVEPESHRVLSMVGGYDFGRSNFNRATQARRQPGSSFKPFIYAAAVEGRTFTAATMMLDAPKVFSDPRTGKDWKPENSDGKFMGDIRLRECLTHSRNPCSVTLVEALLPETVTALARKVGLGEGWPNNLTLALGTGEVTTLTMANAYATFADAGQYAPPVVLERVKRMGTDEVLLEAESPHTQVLSPAAAFVTLSMMKSVVEAGTARSIRELGRPVAGKTGTTNDARDAWFAGCVPGLCTAVWVGMDNNEGLGSSEFGGRAAAPAFLEFYQGALEGSPVRDFDVPEGVVSVRVDPHTGLLARAGQVDALEEFFLAGTEPTETAEGGDGATPAANWAEDPF